MATLILDDIELPTARSLDLGVITASQVAFASAGILCGWSLEEDTGAALAKVRLWDGGAAGTDKFATITLQAGQSTRDWLGRPYLRIERGLFVEVVAGTVDVQFWAVLL